MHPTGPNAPSARASQAEVGAVDLPRRHRYEDLDLERRHRYDVWWWYRHHLPGWLAFTLPIVMALVPLVVAALTIPYALPNLFVFQVTIVVALDVAILFATIVGFTWWLTLAVSLWMEFFLLLWLLKNLDFLRRFQWIDRFFRRREQRALELYRRRSWLRRFHFWGVVVFTFLPLNSGVILGVLVGKITGMHDRRVLAAVFFGISLWAAFIVWIVTLSIEAFAPLVDDLKEKLPGTP